MSMQDPIADMLSRIKNALAVTAREVNMYASKVKIAIADVLKAEGYITDYRVEKLSGNRGTLVLVLKYYQGEPVIRNVRRISRPGLRVYKNADKLPKVMDGLGISVISTSKGIMSDRKARGQGLGGEILCYVS
jgi:small subunit ribosomal protein S8